MQQTLSDERKNMKKILTWVVFALLAVIIVRLGNELINELQKGPIKNNPVHGNTSNQFEDTHSVSNSLSKEQALAIGDQTQIQSFGNGVYYFPFVRDEFRYTVSAFLSIHTNLEVLAVSEDVIRQSRIDSNHSDDWRADYGATVGHTIFFREKH